MDTYYNVDLHYSLASCPHEAFKVQIELPHLCGRRFAYFSHHEDFVKWYGKVMRLEDKLSMYEIIPSDRQKFKVDIDSYTKIDISDIIKICNYINELVPKCRLLVYTSNGLSSNGKYKWSYHIIEYKYKMINNVQCKDIAATLYNRFKCIDLAVYKSLQMFRLEGSSKLMENRKKRMIANIVYDGVNRETNILDGMVSYVRMCEDLNLPLKIYPIVKKPVVTNPVVTNPIVTNPVATRCVTSNVTSNDVDNDDHTIANILTKGSCVPFQKSNNIIMLKRIRPSYCKVCSRIHDSENPYISTFSKSSLLEFRLYCRRSDGYVSMVISQGGIVESVCIK